MGLGLGFSDCGCSKKDDFSVVKIPLPSPQSAKILPNPDPKNWVILKTYENSKYTLVKVQYPDCTNYEGVKILLYQGISASNLEKLKYLDPHFCEGCISPIARFEPTELGWKMGEKLMFGLLEKSE